MRATRQMWSVRAVLIAIVVASSFALIGVQVSADEDNFARFSNGVVDCTGLAGNVTLDFAFREGSRLVTTITMNQGGMDISYSEEMITPQMSGSTPTPFQVMAEGSINMKMELYNPTGSLASTSEFFAACPSGQIRLDFANANAEPEVLDANTAMTAVLAPVPGCDATIQIPANAVEGVFVTDASVSWAPGQLAAPAVTIDAGNATRVIGIDQTGQFYQVLWGCQYLWVPANSLAPNPNAVVQGQSLPTNVVG